MSISHAPPDSPGPDISHISTAKIDPHDRPPLDLVPLAPISSRRTRVPRWLRRTTGPLVLLALWQLLSSTGVLTSGVLASPGRIAHVGWDLVDAPVQMLRTVPFVGLIPLFIIWFGIGEAPKVAVITLGVTFPLYLNVYAGIRGVDSQLIEAGESLGLSRWGLVRHVVLPGALPNAMTGLRYSLGIAWLALVFAEQINADAGIGFLMVQARDFLQTDVIVVCLIVYAFLGLLADFLVRTLERLLLQWRPTFTGR